MTAEAPTPSEAAQLAAAEAVVGGDDEAERAQLRHGHGAGGPGVAAALGAGGVQGGHEAAKGVEGEVDAEVFRNHTRYR